jgi:hypothetical protein
VAVTVVVDLAHHHHVCFLHSIQQSVPPEKHEARDPNRAVWRRPEMQSPIGPRTLDLLSECARVMYVPAFKKGGH